MADQLVADVTTDHQLVTGPDGKQYRFSKKFNQQQINSYFKRKNIVAPNKTAPKTEDAPTTGGSPGNVGMMQNYGLGFGTAVKEYGASALPDVGGAIGGTVLGKKGAFLGGVVGEDLRQMIMRPILLGRGQQDMDVQESLKAMMVEGGKQATYQYIGEKAGELFYRLLDKIPHAAVKKGIPLLPGDLDPGSKLSKYTEDLLSNLAPSAKTMQEFRAGQNAAIQKQTDKIANGFAKFSGTSEETGILLQNTLRAERDAAQANLKKMFKAGGFKSMAEAMKDKSFNTAMKQFNDNFDYELMKSILRTNKPELITGWFRVPKTSLGETRLLTDFLHEIKPDTLGKVQNRLMRDIVSESFTGSKDPTLKGTQNLTRNFSGSKFKSILDQVGEEKLKALYGEKNYKAITNFTHLVEHIDKTQGSGVGRFLNLMFLLPFRGGMTAKSTGKVVGMGVLANRAAKLITSPQGVKLYEDYIRAVGAQSPRLIDLARNEIRAFNERSDAEDEQIKKEAEQEYEKEKGQQK